MFDSVKMRDGQRMMNLSVYVAQHYGNVRVMDYDPETRSLYIDYKQLNIIVWSGGKERMPGSGMARFKRT